MKLTAITVSVAQPCFAGSASKLGQIDDREFRIEALQLFRRRADQQLVHEQRVPGIFGDDAHRQAMGEVGAAEQILGEQLAALRVGHHVGIERIEMRRAHRLVVVPPDLVFGGRIAHDEFVGGRTAGVLAGEDDQRAVLGDMAFAARDGVFVELRARSDSSSPL